MSGGRHPRIGIPWSAGGGQMGAITHVATGQYYSSASDVTLTVTGLSRSAGDILIAHVAWEDVSTTASIPGFTMLSVANDGNNYTVIGYLLNASASSADVTATLGSNASYRCLELMQFRPTNAGVAVFDIHGSGSGVGTSMASGSITTTGGANAIVVGTAKNYQPQNFSAFQIGGVNADGYTINSGALSGVWYRLPTSNLTGVTATATGGSGKWVARIVAIK